MALRRKSKPAQTEFDAITDRLDRVERALQVSRQPGPTSMQSVDTETYHDPAPWETVINWPGSHIPATPSDPFQYYHPGDTAMGGSTAAGYKAISGVKPIPWVRRGKDFGQHFPVAGNNTVDGDETLTYSTVVEGSTDASSYFVLPHPLSFTIRPKVTGWYLCVIEAIWEDEFVSLVGDMKPAWFRIHDGTSFPTGLGADISPGYGQLGATTSGLWIGRHEAFKDFQIDVQQLSGITQFLDAWYVEIAFLGAYTGPHRDESLVWTQ